MRKYVLQKDGGESQIQYLIDGGLTTNLLQEFNTKSTEVR